ncbi:MAG: carbon starvation protein A [Defluviitaleaceae bacterium]|nr:carbon starvation protein A [Defluviitaleaceae bacterium]
MISFFVAAAILVFGYYVYAKVVEKVFVVNVDAVTPVYAKADGVDYVPISEKKAMMIQFISIAGTGPIFGAIQGALWGPAAFFWIVLGCVFAGAVHDYTSGMLSMRQDGATIAEIIGRYLGPHIKILSRILSLGLLIMLGAIFTVTPSDILVTITPFPREFWMIIIIGYFVIATIIPINKLIAKVYPIFGAGMILLGVGLAVALFTSGDIFRVPEFSFSNPHPAGRILFPFMFITIACGAISGFHSTQSPLMARCIRNEREGRRVFYGAMVFEGFMALIWAAVAMTFFPEGLIGLAAAGAPPVVVSAIGFGYFGAVGGIIAILCVGIFPISSGDTALRVSRLTLADMLNLDQAPIINRFKLALPLFAVVIALFFIDFTVLWMYSAWINQTLASITLWAGAVYLANRKQFHWICTLPAIFMTFLVNAYLFVAPLGQGFNLAPQIAYPLGGLVAFTCFAIFIKKCLLPKRSIA